MSEETKISAKIGNFRGVKLHKTCDAWNKDGELPPAFDGYGRKVSPPPWY